MFPCCWVCRLLLLSACYSYIAGVPWVNLSISLLSVWDACWCVVLILLSGICVSVWWSLLWVKATSSLEYAVGMNLAMCGVLLQWMPVAGPYLGEALSLNAWPPLCWHLVYQPRALFAVDVFLSQGCLCLLPYCCFVRALSVPTLFLSR
jgi:hypothetical protein